jgi:hypothetical protein
MSNEALEHKQRCADRLQFIAHQQADVLNQIQRNDYIATPDLKMRLDLLVTEYAQAVTDFEAASVECEAPVLVKVFARR